RSGALRSGAEAERKKPPPNMGLCQIKFQLEQLIRRPGASTDGEYRLPHSLVPPVPCLGAG
ncbi:MAG TPA: hypothetical protein VFJ47_16540, partial [Terriglobales bacterium]|nr:hypothetical protein [Terriglobales bacterium]